MKIEKLLRKVPNVTVLFWTIKLLSTAMGEVTSDFLVHRLDPIIAVAIGGIGLTGSLTLQLWVKKYIPWVYWLAVVMVAVFGTMAADILHIGLGIPYVVSTVSFAISLGVIFVLWQMTEKTLSMHSITTQRRELFYWATVITTFALGTAAGDMTAVTFHLGYLTSGVLFGVLFALPLILRKTFGINDVFTFWFAYIMTHPFGASFADLVGKTQAAGGLGVGTGVVSGVLAICIAILVFYATRTQKEVHTSGTI